MRNRGLARRRANDAAFRQRDEHGVTAGRREALGAGHDSDPFNFRGYASWLLLALCLFFLGESLLASRG